jgi:hypothetical protein
MVVKSPIQTWNRLPNNTKKIVALVVLVSAWFIWPLLLTAIFFWYLAYFLAGPREDLRYKVALTVSISLVVATVGLAALVSVILSRDEKPKVVHAPESPCRRVPPDLIASTIEGSVAGQAGLRVFQVYAIHGDSLDDCSATVVTNAGQKIFRFEITEINKAGYIKGSLYP